MIRTPAQVFAVRRSLLIGLVLFVAIVGLTLAVSAARKGNRTIPGSPARESNTRPTKPLSKLTDGKGVSPLTVSIAATLADDITLANKKNPGDTITYTLNITNSGTTDATGINFSDIIDSHTTLVGSSGVLATDDAYNTIGNVQISVPAPGLLINDRDITAGNNTGMTTTATTISSSQCAACNNVTISADGSFTYDPPLAFSGTDTFTYTAVTAGGKTATATARITVSGQLWFINDNAGACPGAPCNGRLSHPFTTLANFQAVNDSGAGHPATGDTIFIFESATSYTGPTTLLSNQKFIGQDATVSLITFTGLTQPSGTDPLPVMNTGAPAVTITSASNGINLGQGNTLRGFTVGATTGAKISGTSFGTLTVGDSTLPDITLSGNGQALNLTTGTFASSSKFASVATTSSTTSGLTLTSIAGTVAFGSTTISGNNNECLITTSSTADINFGNTSCTANVVSLSGNTAGTRTFGTLQVTGGSGNAFSHSGGGGNVTVIGLATLSSVAPDTIVIQNAASGNLINFAGGATVTHTGTGGNGIQWSGTNTGATLTFATLALTTSNGTGMNLSGGGTVNVTTALGSSISATGDAANNGAAIIANGIALGANVTSVSSTNNGFAGSNGISLTSVTGTSSFGTGALSGSAGDAFFVGGENGSFTYNGTIASGSAHSVNITGKTGGTVNFGGAITDTDTGITLTSNGGGAGATINFTGSIDLTTNANAAFTATGGGTISATGSGSNIVTTTGTAVNVANTTIGASNLKFESVSAGTGASGPASGIILNTTGASGYLTVTGDGNASVGGNSSGGTIQHTTSNGISLTSTTSATFADMNIHDTGGSGINGIGVTHFTFTNGTITNAGNANAESAIAFNGVPPSPSAPGNNIVGTLTVTENIFTNAFYTGLDVQNDSGTVTNATVSNNTITNPGSNGINFNDSGNDSTSGSIDNATISNNTISGAGGDGIQVKAANGNPAGPGAHAGLVTLDANLRPVSDPSNIISITGNLITLDPGATQAIAIFCGGSGTNSASRLQVNCEIKNNGTVANPITGSSIQTDIFISNNGYADMAGVVDNNVINANHNDPAGGGANGIFGGNGTGGTPATVYTPRLTLAVTNNTISNTNGNDILLVSRSGTSTGGSGKAYLKIANNSATTPNNLDAFARECIRVESGNGASADDEVYLNIFGNTAQIGSNGALGIGVRKQGTVQTTNDFALFDDAGGPALANCPNPSNTDITNFINALNPAGNGTDIITGSGYKCDTTLAPPIAPPDGGDNPEKALVTSAPTLDGRSSSSLQTFPWQNHPTRSTADLVASLTSLHTSDSLTTGAATTTELPSTEASTSPLTIAVAEGSDPSKQVAPISGRLKQALHPVASFATQLAFLGSSIDNWLTPSVSAAPSSESTESAQQKGVTPQSGETFNASIGTLHAGESAQITFQVTVDTPPQAKSASTQGSVTGSNFTVVNGISTTPNTNDPETGAANDATVTNLNVTSTWTGLTSIDWNDPTNWNPSTYAPGVSNPAVNDVLIPNVGNQPNISATDIGVFSLNISNGRTLTITSPRILTIGGAPGGNLTLDGIISGGELRFGTGTHSITNAGGTGSLSSTNLTTVLSGATVTLNNNLQMGALAINAGGSMTIANTTLSLSGPGAALTLGGTFTPRAIGDDGSPGAPPGDGLDAVGSIVVYNGTSAQTGPGIAYFGLRVNNAAGVTLDNDATVSQTLALTSGDLHMGATDQFTLTQANTIASTGTGDVTGSVKRTGAPLPNSALTYGNPTNLITLAGSAVTSMNVKLSKAVPSDANTGGTNTGFNTAVQRTYLITPTGAFTSATLQLHYLDAELNSNDENTMTLWRYDSVLGKWQTKGATSRDTTNNWVQLTGVTAFSPWTFNSTFPTATPGNISGHIADNTGNPVEGATVYLSGAQNRKFITDRNGNYSFDNVETNGFYTVTPLRANYTFSPASRSFSQLGNTTEAAFSGSLATSGSPLNPLDTPEYFVRQQYLDFLSREPDEAGFNFWSDQILSCNSDAACVDVKRNNVSAAFFLSIEFQQTGYLVYRMYQAAFGDRPGQPVPLNLAEFKPDSATISNGVIVNKSGWEGVLETNKQAFATAFAQRARFTTLYSGMNDGQFVDTLNHNAGSVLTPAERDQLVSDLSTSAKTRAQVLRSVAENSTLAQQEFTQAFVLMQYFGYLQRDANSGPDTDFAGYNFWLVKLNTFGGNFQDAEMVKAFLVSGEYRQRFPR